MRGHLENMAEYQGFSDVVRGRNKKLRTLITRRS